MDSDLISRVKWGNVGLALLVMVMLAVLVGWPALGPAEPVLPEEVAPVAVTPTAVEARSQPARQAETAAVRDVVAAKPRKPRAPRKRRARPRRSAHARRVAPAPAYAPPAPSEFGFER